MHSQYAPRVPSRPSGVCLTGEQFAHWKSNDRLHDDLEATPLQSLVARLWVRCVTWCALPPAGIVVEYLLAAMVVVFLAFRFNVNAIKDRIGDGTDVATAEDLASCAYLTLSLLFLEVRTMRHERMRRRDHFYRKSAATAAQWLFGLLCMCT
mmetsp:Transcript_107587/g.302929  ORF Transcript_107587/g.302929 Transcript_107587/m.302929 type:complete len:152 (+) Transcript_107587:186-641(+)